MTGYFNRPDATAAAFCEDGWLKTGDLVEVLPTGDLKFSARLSDMFKSGGYNIYPREIELVLEQHPAISSAAVVGVPDEFYGESGYAFLQPQGQASPDADALKDWCKSHLSNYKVPKVFDLITAMPLLPNGKLDKSALKHSAVSRNSECPDRGGDKLLEE
jgi:acyl-CoA synthetase (AMP-forming)/AMP-acid ligase II